MLRDTLGSLERQVLESQTSERRLRELVDVSPVGISVGNTQLAEYELPHAHPARAYLAGATQAGLRARDRVAKILTFSRRSEQQFGVHSIVPVIHEALDLLRASLPATIDIRRELEPGLQPVRCAPGQMHQVVMNLCANAAHDGTA